MKTPLTYGLGIAFAVSMLSLVSHLTGLSTDPNKMIVGMIVGIFGLLVIYIVGITLGTKHARNERGDLGFTYGQAFKTGLLIAVFSAFGSLVFNFIYFQFIHPDFAETQVASTQALLERMNAPSAKIEEVLEEVRAKATIGRQLRGAFIFSAILGTIISLITAAVLKRPAETQPPVVG